MNLGLASVLKAKKEGKGGGEMEDGGNDSSEEE